MSEKWPQVGDLVVVTVQRIVSYGAYVTLDEYENSEGLLHISEISSSWVRNIRNHVRERQKVVLQVLRVDATHGQVDLSLRRVTRDERRKKTMEWKKNRKAETLIKNATDFLGMIEKEVLEVKEKLIEYYGSLYSALETASKKGIEALTEAKIPKNVAEILEKIAREKIVVKGVTIHGFMEISSMEPRGVEEIKQTLLESKKIAAKFEAESTLSTLGAPKYRIEVTAEDYRKAEQVLEEIVKHTRSSWDKHDGSFSFSRE
jgi:translation initiation factor 2 subunit 1